MANQILSSSKMGKNFNSNTFFVALLLIITIMIPSTSSAETCNYAKGRWEEDAGRPLYSGFGCKQWLQDLSCRLTNRTDFAYENFRWKPFSCEMPNFDGEQFLVRMKDKTIAYIGDSLGRQQFNSLMCMATGGKFREDVVNVGWEYGLVKAPGAIRPAGWAYRFPNTNTTILWYWSASLCDLEPIDPGNKTTDYAMHLDRPSAFLRSYLDRFDVLVLNTGHHWYKEKINANRWVMHVGGVRVPNDGKLANVELAKNFTIYSIVKWVDQQLPTHPRLKAFFRTMSPRHTFCNNTVPLSGGKEVTQDESLDYSASGAVRGTKVELLDITAISQLRDEGHTRYGNATLGTQDCSHWCLPGIPDTWNELMVAQLSGLGVVAVQPQGNSSVLPPQPNSSLVVRSCKIVVHLGFTLILLLLL